LAGLESQFRTLLNGIDAAKENRKPWSVFFTTASRFTNGRAYLPDADSAIGEKIADTPGVLALCLNETMVAPAMTRVFERGCEKLVLPGLGFETQTFFQQCAIKTDANFVGFTFELR
jgi:hypothetical protein